MSKKIYHFQVDCCYDYKIKANNEEHARKILVDQGGIEIQGTFRYLDNAYADATLTEVEDNE
jgi:hypothetical protein|tara:strand:+ start:507 stop:692 length:186 start_codon:yes stop_codon:yes gene_type:complete